MVTEQGQGILTLLILKNAARRESIATRKVTRGEEGAAQTTSGNGPLAACAERDGIPLKPFCACSQLALHASA
jgi:hypothetical protein